MVKNLREKVSWCQREHPVTHYYDCADIVGKYLKLVKVLVKEGGREGWTDVDFCCLCESDALTLVLGALDSIRQRDADFPLLYHPPTPLTNRTRCVACRYQARPLRSRESRGLYL